MVGTVTGPYYRNSLPAIREFPEDSDEPPVQPMILFRRKTKPATRQGRRASLSIHGPDRAVSKSLRWTDLRGPGAADQAGPGDSGRVISPAPEWDAETDVGT